MKIAGIPIFIIALALVPGSIQGEDDKADGSTIPHQVPLISGPIVINGSLDDEAWHQALELEMKYEVRPGENVEPPVRTLVLLAYDKSTLYIAFRAFDPDPAAIRAHLMDRDSAWYDDWVGVVLDTFNDERRSFDFLVNPFGIQMDFTETSDSEDNGFDAIWDSKGRVYDWGFAVEIAIPFTSLRFQRTGEDQIWGFDALRSYKRNVDHRMGLFPRDRNNNCYLCQTVKIKGFAGVDPGRNLEIVPTLTAVRTDARDEIPGGDFQELNSDVEAGITARWGFTPNMTINATVNPDFSQVEADSLQLDINEPFALYFNERRPFFTEGADFFRTPFDIVYTRTMRDPTWGLKLTGKEGANTIGAYVVRDESNNLIFPGSQGSSATSLHENVTASVFRYKRDIGSKYTLGVMATDREGGDYYNRVFGFDGGFRFTNTDYLSLTAYGSSTRYSQKIAQNFSQPEGGFSDYLWEAYYSHSTRDYSLYGQYADVGKRFSCGSRPYATGRLQEGRNRRHLPLVGRQRRLLHPHNSKRQLGQDRGTGRIADRGGNRGLSHTVGSQAVQYLPFLRHPRQVLRGQAVRSGVPGRRLRNKSDRQSRGRNLLPLRRQDRLRPRPRGQGPQLAGLLA